MSSNFPPYQPWTTQSYASRANDSISPFQPISSYSPPIPTFSYSSITPTISQQAPLQGRVGPQNIPSYTNTFNQYNPQSNVPSRSPFPQTPGQTVPSFAPALSGARTLISVPPLPQTSFSSGVTSPSIWSRFTSLFSVNKPLSLALDPSGLKFPSSMPSSSGLGIVPYDSFAASRLSASVISSANSLALSHRVTQFPPSASYTGGSFAPFPRSGLSFSTPAFPVTDKAAQERSSQRLIDDAMRRIMYDKFSPGLPLFTPTESLQKFCGNAGLGMRFFAAELNRQGAPVAVHPLANGVLTGDSSQLIRRLELERAAASSQFLSRPTVVMFSPPSTLQSSSAPQGVSFAELGRRIASRLTHELYDEVMAPIASSAATVVDTFNKVMPFLVIEPLRDSLAESVRRDHAGIDQFFGTDLAGRSLVLEGVSLVGLPLPGGALRSSAMKTSAVRSRLLTSPYPIRIFEKNIGHIFRDASGHLPDTPINRTLLIEIASNPRNYLGKDKYGNAWHAHMQSDTAQIWTVSRNGQIRNGGVNHQPRSFNATTGLSANAGTITEGAMKHE